jgi:hypothetical protein
LTQTTVELFFLCDRLPNIEEGLVVNQFIGIVLCSKYVRIKPEFMLTYPVSQRRSLPGIKYRVVFVRENENRLGFKFH